MKKLLALVLALVMILSLSLAYAEPVTITYAHFSGSGAQEETLKKMIEIFESKNPDIKVALLDIMLPGEIDGFEVCRRIRASDSQIGIIMLTARTQEMEKVGGLMMGADDYVTKPFNATELLLRVEANIRRHKDTIDFARCRNREGVARIGELEVRFGEYEVRVKGKPVALTTKEFEIVAFLAAHPGKVFTRSQIQEYIWGESDADCKPTNNITVFVRKIREKIEENPSEPKYLLTVQRVGYKMADSLE